MPQPLASKEGALFRQVIRNYEDKQYKRGLKSADLILKKFPRHGDTMAMKALIMNAQNRGDEAFALAKDALTADMKSHICWHVYGLLWRSVKNFEEAIKAYKFALKLDPENSQIQRDLAILQVQTRDYQGYIQSRSSMLQAKPQFRQVWTALAVAHHLAGDVAEAEKVLTTYEDTLKTAPARGDYENSEAILYKNSLISEQGDYGRALEHLESATKHSLDRLAVLEARAECLSHLDRKEDAARAYRKLLDRNPEHPEYYEGLLANSGIPAEDSAARKAIFDEYAQKFPRSDAAKRLPLDFLQGDLFVDAARTYLAFMLGRGIPSTFHNVKHLYADASKKDTLASIVSEYLESQTKTANGAANGDESKGETAALYYLAQHYNYRLSRDLSRAMEYIDRAIERIPDSVDFHMTKARIWKHIGNVSKAAEVMDQSRSLDTRDRYINTKAAKYQLRNDENERALKTMGLFTRAETVGGPMTDLLDMQCLWFLTEDGEAFARRGEVAMALKRFHQVHGIFEVWSDDQFDFHTFYLRKGQARAYVDMIRWEDRLQEHPFYSRAALDAVRVYLSMHDAAAGKGNANGEGANGEDEAEKKKAARKARKEAQRVEREAAEQAGKQDPNKAVVIEEGKKKDDDPQGLKLAATTEPLKEAMTFLEPLLKYSPKSLDAQLAGFDVHLRRSKFHLYPFHPFHPFLPFLPFLPKKGIL
ncbi:MAG: tetratricopeptide repeat protein, partial [Acidobacteria bacterium]|nr:tetratricopeptide repeat protein [Acidobacteriota bacterium]